MTKIIMVKNKAGNYPYNWTPLFYYEGSYWLCGGRSTPILLVKSAKEAQKVMYKARKRLERFNLIYYTVNCEFEDD